MSSRQTHLYSLVDNYVHKDVGWNTLKFSSEKAAHQYGFTRMSKVFLLEISKQERSQTKKLENNLVGLILGGKVISVAETRNREMPESSTVTRNTAYL